MLTRCLFQVSSWQQEGLQRAQEARGVEMQAGGEISFSGLLLEGGSAACGRFWGQLSGAWWRCRWAGSSELLLLWWSCVPSPTAPVCPAVSQFRSPLGHSQTGTQLPAHVVPGGALCCAGQGAQTVQTLCALLLAQYPHLFQPCLPTGVFQGILTVSSCCCCFACCSRGHSSVAIGNMCGIKWAALRGCCGVHWREQTLTSCFRWACGQGGYAGVCGVWSVL